MGHDQNLVVTDLWDLLTTKEILISALVFNYYCSRMHTCRVSILDKREWLYVYDGWQMINSMQWYRTWFWNDEQDGLQSKMWTKDLWTTSAAAKVVIQDTSIAYRIQLMTSNTSWLFHMWSVLQMRTGMDIKGLYLRAMAWYVVFTVMSWMKDGMDNDDRVVAICFSHKSPTRWDRNKDRVAERRQKILYSLIRA